HHRGRRYRLLAGCDGHVLGGSPGRPTIGNALWAAGIDSPGEGRAGRTLGCPLWFYGHLHLATPSGCAPSNRNSGGHCPHELQGVFAIHAAWLGAVVRRLMLRWHQNGSGRKTDERRIAPYFTLARWSDARVGRHVLLFRPSPHAGEAAYLAKG